MATASFTRPTGSVSAAERNGRGAQPKDSSLFGWQHLAQDDLEAGLSVSLIIAGVVFLGLIDMIFTVLWTL